MHLSPRKLGATQHASHRRWHRALVSTSKGSPAAHLAPREAIAHDLGGRAAVPPAQQHIPAGRGHKHATSAPGVFRTRQHIRAPWAGPPDQQSPLLPGPAQGMLYKGQERLHANPSSRAPAFQVQVGDPSRVKVRHGLRYTAVQGGTLMQQSARKPRHAAKQAGGTAIASPHSSWAPSQAGRWPGCITVRCRSRCRLRGNRGRAICIPSKCADAANAPTSLEAQPHTVVLWQSLTLCQSLPLQCPGHRPREPAWR
jgi:hypothetical protein